MTRQMRLVDCTLVLDPNEIVLPSRRGEVDRDVDGVAETVGHEQSALGGEMEVGESGVRERERVGVDGFEQRKHEQVMRVGREGRVDGRRVSWSDLGEGLWREEMGAGDEFWRGADDAEMVDRVEPCGGEVDRGERGCGGSAEKGRREPQGRARGSGRYREIVDDAELAHPLASHPTVLTVVEDSTRGVKEERP